jgi:hypothetical protein
MNKYCCLLLLFSVLYGCKKDSNGSPYYFTFQVGAKQYSVDSAYADTASPGIGFYIHNKSTQAEISKNYLIDVSFLGYIGYNSPDTTVIGAYTDPATDGRLDESNLTISIPNDANNGQFFSGGLWPFTISITEKNAQYISGTFQGQLNEIIISNGKFKVPYVK